MEFDFDVVVIGSGPAGYVSAIRAAQLGLKTAIVEKRKTLGGTCLNVGCIPSKTLLYASELYQKMQKEAVHFGCKVEGLSYDWNTMLSKKEKVVEGLNEGVAGLLKKNKITSLWGEASFSTPQTIVVTSSEGEKKVSSSFFIIATGSEPTPLPFLPFDEKKVVSSTGALSLDKVPKKLAVIGAGVIGVELGSVFKRLGSEVVFIEFMDRVCPTFDVGLSKALHTSLVKQGMEFFLSTKVTGAAQSLNSIELSLEKKSGDVQKIEADVVLVSVGRRPFTQNLGLEKIGISLTEKGQIPVDGNFKTKHPHILAIGDVIDGPMLAHKASEEGIVAAEICKGLSPSFDYMQIPNVIYTSPEVASVGFTEEELKERNIPFKSGNYPFKGNSRARCTEEEDGFAKVLIDEKTEKVLGVHMIGAHASEMISLAALLLGQKAEKLNHLCFAHPTLSESLKEAGLSLYLRAIHK